MKKILVICLLSVGSYNSEAQNYVLSPLGIKFPNYTTANRPAANSIGVGTILYNATDNVHQFSNGTAWLNVAGTTALPSGTVNQTLRNNGSGWVTSDLMRNDGSRILIGSGNYTPPGALFNVNTLAGERGIYVTSQDVIAITAQTTSNPAIAGYSVFGSGVFGSSTNGYGVNGISDNYPGVYGASTNGNGGEFYGRVKIVQGGNGTAGVDLETLGINQRAFIGLGFANELGVYGYAYNNWIQRWNYSIGTICYATAPTICSDIRLKKDFKFLSNSLQSVASLQGYNYYLKNEKNPNLQTGFIAQEIQKIFPELVNEVSDGYLAVDYTGLIPHLVESVKSLKSENEYLLKRLTKIEELLKISENNLEAKR